MLGVHKGHRASTVRYKRRVRWFTPRNQVFRVSNLTSTGTQLQTNNPLLTTHQTFQNRTASQKVTTKPLTRQRAEVKSFLKKQFISWNHQRRFIKVKNQVFARIRRGRSYSRYISRNRGSRAHKFSNFRQYMLRARLVSPYTCFKKRSLFTKPVSMYVHLLTQSKSSDVQK